MHPSALFYTKEFKALLSDLKTKGHLRNTKPLKNMDRIFYENIVAIIVILCMLSAVYLWQGLSFTKPLPAYFLVLLMFTALFVFGPIAAMFVLIRRKINYEIIPYTLRQKRDGIVLEFGIDRYSRAAHGIAPMAMTGSSAILSAMTALTIHGKSKGVPVGAGIHYTITDGRDAYSEYYTFYYPVRLASAQGRLLKELPQKGDKIKICVHPKDHSKNAPYLSHLNQEYSLISAPPPILV